MHHICRKYNLRNFYFFVLEFSICHEFFSEISIKIDIVGDIKCLNEEEGIYLVLSNWHCKTMKGSEGICPMVEIITIKEFKIVHAIAMMDTTEIGRF